MKGKSSTGKKSKPTRRILRSIGKTSKKPRKPAISAKSTSIGTERARRPKAKGASAARVVKVKAQVAERKKPPRRASLAASKLRSGTRAPTPPSSEVIPSASLVVPSSRPQQPGVTEQLKKAGEVPVETSELQGIVEPKIPSPPKTAVAPPASQLPKEPAKAPFNIPPILLEGDEPTPLSISGAGAKYAVGPGRPPAVASAPEQLLPAGYGTQKLFLTARDPHCLYAHWDLTQAQQQHYNSLSSDKHLILRVRPEAGAISSALEIHLQPETRHWFIPVERSGTSYIAELGCYDRSGQWVLVAKAEPAWTPPDRLSEDRTFELAHVTSEPPAAMRPVGTPSMAAPRYDEQFHHDQGAPFARSERELQPSRWRGQVFGTLTTPRSVGFREQQWLAQPPAWTREKEEALEEIAGIAGIHHEWFGSIEIAELVRGVRIRKIRQAELELPAPSSAAPGIPNVVSLEQISSPMPEQKQPEKGFWFNINAEIVIYGATEPDAHLTIAGRPMRLRPDGTFSLRFALPDGEYALEAAARSAHGDQRQADLQFSRATKYHGEVTRHPQDESLKEMPRAKANK
jgi:hypothetical protein